MDAPGTVPRRRPSRGRGTPATLAVGSERGGLGVGLSDAAAGPALDAVPPTRAAGPASGAGEVLEVTGVTSAAPSPAGELVLSPVAPPTGRGRRAWARLSRLLPRRPVSGRHRPGTLGTGWSMFAPERGRGRRRGTPPA